MGGEVLHGELRRQGAARIRPCGHPIQASEIQKWTHRRESATHEPDRANLPAGLDAQQRVPTGFKAATCDLGIEEATKEV